MQEAEVDFASAAEETTRTTDPEERLGVAAKAPIPQEERIDKPEGDHKGKFQEPPGLDQNLDKLVRSVEGTMAKSTQRLSWLQPAEGEPGAPPAQTAQQKTKPVEPAPLHMELQVEAPPVCALASAGPPKLPGEGISTGAARQGQTAAESIVSGDIVHP